jgi:hypothetical protein
LFDENKTVWRTYENNGLKNEFKYEKQYKYYMILMNNKKKKEDKT